MHGDRHRPRPPVMRSIRLFEVVIFAGFISIVAFCAYDGFKEIFTKPVPFKPKEAVDSIAELKATIAMAKESTNPHKYVKAAQAERRSALQSSGNQSQPVSDVYNSDPKLVSAQEEEEPHYTKVILVSALQEQSCIAEGGNELHYFSVRNKQDYARLHGYDFVLGIKQVDPRLENMWNKPAWILKVLEDEERAGEWIIWTDIDTVIIDANFTLPYEQFAANSKDLVVYGNLTQVKAGHPLEALNTGVMLIRNSPWSRKFFAEVNRLGSMDDHHLGKNTLSQILLKELQAAAYSDGLRDQNAVIYLLKTHPEWHDRVAFLDKEVCLNCYWRDLIGVTGFGKPDYERRENVTFIQHFMGCQTCNALNRNGDLDSCRDAMFHSFEHVKAYQQPMLADARPRGEREYAQLRELPYCSLNPTADGCKGAKPLDASKHIAASPLYDWKSVDNAVVGSTLLKIKGREGNHNVTSSVIPDPTADNVRDADVSAQPTELVESERAATRKLERRESRDVTAREGRKRRHRPRQHVRLSTSRAGFFE